MPIHTQGNTSCSCFVLNTLFGWIILVKVILPFHFLWCSKKSYPKIQLHFSIRLWWKQRAMLEYLGSNQMMTFKAKTGTTVVAWGKDITFDDSIPHGWKLMFWLFHFLSSTLKWPDKSSEGMPRCLDNCPSFLSKVVEPVEAPVIGLAKPRLMEISGEPRRYLSFLLSL